MWNTNQSDDAWSTGQKVKLESKEFPVKVIIGVDVEEQIFLLGVDKTIKDKDAQEELCDMIDNIIYWFENANVLNKDLIKVPVNAGIYVFEGYAIADDWNDFSYFGEFKKATFEDFSLI